MLHDLQNRTDIETLINRFYDKVKVDPLIGFFFSEVVPVDWPAHLPRMYDFWESIAFGSGNYKGEPMTPHFNLNKKQKMEPAHFERWLSLFYATMDENFAGEKAEEVKKRAGSIAAIMEHKLRG
jgi:hemoglobin